MIDCVLDASAILASIRDEPGARPVDERLGRQSAAASAVNVAEVASRLADRGMTPELVEQTLIGLDLDVRPFDHSLALATGALRPLTRHRGLSLGDRACLALAQSLGLPAITMDRAWADLELPIEVVVLARDAG